MRPHTTHHRQAARRAVETEREAYELACEADAADAAAPYDALEPTCCGCVVCCCSACDDGYRSARVTEAREERYRREWTEARRRRSALGVGLPRAPLLRPVLDRPRAVQLHLRLRPTGRADHAPPVGCDGARRRVRAVQRVGADRLPGDVPGRPRRLTAAGQFSGRAQV